jgi:hypothetical protein
MEATDTVLLLHVPPASASLRLAVLPTHVFAAPVIAAGSAVTLTVFVAMQPVINI